MSEMKPRERVLTALKVGVPDRVPFLEATIDKGIQVKVMGREDFTPPELAERLGLDGFEFDFLPPIYAKREVRDGINYITEGLLTSREALKMVEFPDPDDEAFYAPAKDFLAKYKGDYAVFARIRLGISPTIMGMGLEGLSYALVDDPGFVEEVIDMYATWTAKLIPHLEALGFDFLWAFDDVAFKAGPMVSPRVIREVFLPKVQKVAEKIHIPWVYHSDGNLMPILDDLLELGMSGIHPIEPGAMDIAEVKRRYGRRVCLLGNIDLHYTLTRGTPEEVEREVRERIEVAGVGGGYIVTSANSIPPYCKVENLLAMARAVKQYGKYSASLL